MQGGPGSVRLRFGGGKVRSVPVFASGGSSTKRVLLCFSTFLKERTVPVPVSVPGKRFRRFRFPLSVSGKTVLTVPVSGSGSVPEPPHNCIDSEGKFVRDAF